MAIPAASRSGMMRSPNHFTAPYVASMTTAQTAA